MKAIYYVLSCLHIRLRTGSEHKCLLVDSLTWPALYSPGQTVLFQHAPRETVTKKQGQDSANTNSVHKNISLCTTKINEILNHNISKKMLYSTGRLAKCKQEVTPAPRLPHGLLKFSHCKHHLEVLHAECSLQQVNFELTTANFS